MILQSRLQFIDILQLQATLLRLERHNATPISETSCNSDTTFALLELLDLVLRVRDLHHVELCMLVIILNDTDPTDALRSHNNTLASLHAFL